MTFQACTGIFPWTCTYYINFCRRRRKFYWGRNIYKVEVVVGFSADYLLIVLRVVPREYNSLEWMSVRENWEPIISRMAYNNVMAISWSYRGRIVLVSSAD